MFARIPNRSHSRGQAMVEMAIILPLLIVLLVMTIDAGRMFFGWVALQNASRIGADYAASHADAWNGPPTPIDQNQLDRYADLVVGDLQALGCQGDVAADVPAPNFDPDGDGVTDFSDGAMARVELDCVFNLLTPLAESFLGNPFTMHASTEFAINRTYVGGVPAPGNPPPPMSCDPGQAMVPDLVGERNQDAFAMWTAAGFTGSYTPAVTNPNKNRRVTSQSPAESCQPPTSPMLVTLS